MKLLFVTPTYPYPPRTGNELIAFHHIKYLAPRHLIDLLSLTNGNTSDRGELADWCNHIEMVALAPWLSRLNQGVGLVADLPWQVAYYRSAKMAQMVNRKLANNTYDVVLFQLTLMAHYLPDRYPGATILSMEDPQVLKSQRWLTWESGFRRLLTRSRIAHLKRYELRHAPRFDRVLLLNESDVLDYRSLLPGAKLDWVPHGIDVDAFCPSAVVPRREGMIVITGNMYHPPNVDGIDYFCREIFPLIRRRVPSASLWLVGARPAAAVRKWAKDPQIKVTGFVPDIRPYLRQAMVSICPVRLKIGTQTKILEALACGTPVVTTSAGNNGVAAISGEQLYVADTPDKLAERVVELLNGNRWEALSQNGRRFVIENFTWEKSVTKLEKILSEVLEASAARGRPR